MTIKVIEKQVEPPVRAEIREPFQEGKFLEIEAWDSGDELTPKIWVRTDERIAKTSVWAGFTLSPDDIDTLINVLGRIKQEVAEWRD